eukprot:NODE_3669_length_1180_cov_71.956481_g3485_i0.p1 GENE.NODE_3669_length_1180_cov_71.956481_g3485_i0~~NODE_3669_length_1180_cov_71.956481_g3485_i0.p1  ORF type:complete len:347 (-),score=23.91 NODE_3669_length_1180_cov_71.956481_g3485_i0:138-1121(-)
MEAVLSQFNLESTLPNFFELYAQETLNDALSAAFYYCYTAFARQFHRLTAYHHRLDEIFHSLWFLLEWKFISTTDATFCENFYGLKRRRARLVDGVTVYEAISSKDKIYTVLIQILLPYIRSKIKAARAAWKEEQRAGELTEGQQTRRGRIRNTFYRSIVPVVSGACEAWRLLYYLLYLFGHTQFYTPWLRLRRMVLCRWSEADMLEWQQEPQKLKFMERSRIALMAAYVLFKLFEWYYNSGPASESLPVPPPPEPPRIPSSLPSDPTLCGICSKTRVNPTVVSNTGFVFCYVCLAGCVCHGFRVLDVHFIKSVGVQQQGRLRRWDY